MRVKCSSGVAEVLPGVRWHDLLTRSTWEVVGIASHPDSAPAAAAPEVPAAAAVAVANDANVAPQRAYSPSSPGGTPVFWCRPVGAVPEAARRWLDDQRPDGAVQFCGDSIAAAILRTLATARPGSPEEFGASDAPQCAGGGKACIDCPMRGNCLAYEPPPPATAG